VRRLIIVLAAGSLVLAGCGGGGSSKSNSKPLTKAEYQAKLEQIAKDVGAQLQKSASKSKAPTEKDLAEAKKAVGVFVGRLEQVNPPAEVAQAHKDLIAAMRRLGNDIEGIFKKVAAAKTPSEGISALFGAPAIQALLKAQQEFKAKGYDLNLNG
jgi:outer membrane murein-binding lipoprotein Lpp